MADSSSVPKAIVRAVDPIGRTVLQTAAPRGTFQIWVPATSQIHIEAKGYETRPQRILTIAIFSVYCKHLSTCPN